jgi:prevent-host-death family protein
MKPIRIEQDIVPVGVFKTRASRYLKQVRTEGRPVVITQNGRAAGVLVPVRDYDELTYRERFVAAIREGLEDIEAGRFIDDDELGKEIERWSREHEPSR